MIKKKEANIKILKPIVDYPQKMADKLAAYTDLVSYSLDSSMTTIPKNIIEPAMRAVLDPSWVHAQAQIIAPEELAFKIKVQTEEMQELVLSMGPTDTFELQLMVQMQVAFLQGLRQSERANKMPDGNKHHVKLLRTSISFMQVYSEILEVLLNYRSKKTKRKRKKITVEMS